MQPLDGRVAIVTGAGRGLGRAYALALARAGAAVVVNDLGWDVGGTEVATSVAQKVVDEIHRGGGSAVASAHDVGDWQDAAELVELALDTFGDLDVLVNNAGIARPSSVAELTEQDWDDVVRVHLKGHAATSHHAVAHWVRRAEHRDASVVHTTSVAALAWSPNAAAYAAAKAGILALSRSISQEGRTLGIRSNVVSPVARTRLSTNASAGRGAAGAHADPFHPDRAAPVVVWLADPRCTATDQIVHVVGRRVVLLAPSSIGYEAVHDTQWTPDDLQRVLTPHLTTGLTPDELLTEPGGRRF